MKWMKSKKKQREKVKNWETKNVRHKNAARGEKTSVFTLIQIISIVSDDR